MQSNDQGRLFQCVSHRRGGEFDLCPSPAAVRSRRSPGAQRLAVLVARAATSPPKLSGQVECTAPGAAASAGQGEPTLAVDDAGAAHECAAAFQPMAFDAACTATGTAPALAAVQEPA